MRGVFICYRREDTGGHAGRIFDRLVEAFDRKRVFMDVASIHPGEDFPQVIEQRLAEVDVVLVLIGPRFMGAGGRVRLLEDNDRVRMEIASALRNGLRTIPVLINGAPMPAAEQLPEDIRKLVERNDALVTDRAFDDTVRSLIRSIDAKAARKRLSAPVAAMLGASSMILMAIALANLQPYLPRGGEDPPIDNEALAVEAPIAEASPSPPAGAPAAEPNAATGGKPPPKLKCKVCDAAGHLSIDGFDVSATGTDAPGKWCDAGCESCLQYTCIARSDP